MVYLHGSTETAALIHVEGYQTFLAFPHAAGLLMVWKKQVFLKSPVKECANPGYLKDLQDCGLAYLEKRFSGSGDQAFFGIFINKYVQRVAFSGSFRNLFGRKKHSVFLSCIFIRCKVNTEIYGLYHNKLLFFSYFDHGFSLILQERVPPKLFFARCASQFVGDFTWIKAVQRATATEFR